MSATKKELTEIDLSKVTQAKYIKLGTNGRWDHLCFEDGTLRLGYDQVAENYTVDQGQQPISDFYRAQGKKDHAATNHARQVMDFYSAGPETLWITFSSGKLWWCQAQEEVEFISHDKQITIDFGSRLKRTVSGWHDCSVSGRTLYMTDISGRLTKTVGYRATVCGIGEQEFKYLIRLLQDQRSPEVERATEDKKRLLTSIELLIARLTWQDFELLSDLIFSSSGWRRTSMVGGAQKTIDLELVMPLTGERAVVQVKSKTDQQQLNEYIERLQGVGADKIFYLYHTSSSDLVCDSEDVILMGSGALAEHVLQSGLVDWLLEKVG